MKVAWGTDRRRALTSRGRDQVPGANRPVTTTTTVDTPTTTTPVEEHQPQINTLACKQRENVARRLPRGGLEGQGVQLPAAPRWLPPDGELRHGSPGTRSSSSRWGGCLAWQLLRLRCVVGGRGERVRVSGTATPCVSRRRQGLAHRGRAGQSGDGDSSLTQCPLLHGVSLLCAGHGQAPQQAVGGSTDTTSPVSVCPAPSRCVFAACLGAPPAWAASPTSPVGRQWQPLSHNTMPQHRRGWVLVE